jgi:hypothetical protein
MLLATWLLTDAPEAPPNSLVFTGACDASAALLLPSGHVLVGDDEDRKQTILRLYDLKQPGPPLQTLDVTTALKPEMPDREVDLEGVTLLGGELVWIGSHSRKGDDADPAPSRHRLAALHLSGSAPPYQTRPAGLYQALLDDLQEFLDRRPGKRLVIDAEVPGTPGKHKPAKDGGVSIEGLTSTPNPGELLVGFRSPLLSAETGADLALAVTLLNADAVLHSGAKARFSPPHLLALGGLGIRDVVYVPERRRYLVLGGPPGPGGPFELYEWDGPGTPGVPSPRGSIAAEQDTSPEVLVPEPGGRSVYIMFDEGERRTESGKRCKSNDVPTSAKSFRAVRMAVP